MIENRYAFGTEGNASLFRAVADAMGTLDDYYRAQGWLEDPTSLRSVAQMRQDESVRNVALTEVIGIFSVFIATCFGKKIFDEIYDRTAKRPIASFLDKVFLSVDNPKEKALEFQDIIYLEDVDTLIVIRAIVKRAETQRVGSLLLQGHRVAHMYLEAHGRTAPIHCHTIQDGTIEIEPRRYLSLVELGRDHQIK